MTKLAGHKSLLELGSRVVPIMGEGMSLESGTRYVITDPARRVLDASVDVTVYEAGTPTIKDYTVDPLFGAVVFDSAPTTPVTIDASYIPRTKIACPRSISLSIERDVLDKTCMDPDSGSRNRMMGLKSASVDVDMLEDLPLLQVYALGGEEKTLFELMTDDSIPKVFSFVPGNGDDIFRAYVNIETHETDASLDDVISSGMTLGSTTRGDVSYGWR